MKDYKKLKQENKDMKVVINGLVDGKMNITCLEEAKSLIAEQKMKLLKAEQAIQAQQPTIMWAVRLSFYNTDESMRMAEYDSPGECWYVNVHSVHASKEAADNLCAKFNRFIKDCEVNKKIDPWHFNTKLEFAEVIEIKPGERILAEGKDYDPFYDDFRKCGIEALWKQFCLQDCSE